MNNEHQILFYEEIKKDTEKFKLSFKVNLKTKKPEFILQSKGEGKNFASHSRFNFLDDDGKLLSNELITPEVARFIMDNFDARGDTASFDIYKSDFENKALKNRPPPKISPNDVRHKLTGSEHSFTSTGEKLAHHWPIFKKYKETGYGSIIRATMTLHQVCSSHCHYCSTIARNRKDSISLEEAKAFVTSLYDDQASFNREHFASYNNEYNQIARSDIRLKGLILSGGGQPNLWPHFEEFVRWLSEKDIDLGLITNGFPKKVSEDVYKHFKWIRISVTPEDASPHYPDKRFDLQYLPKSIISNPQITVGYSYVYGPWTDDDILNRIDKSLDENGFDYCRMLTDCNLTRGAQLRAHQSLADRLFTLGYISQDGAPLKKIFHQLKYHGNPDEVDSVWATGQCQLQIYNVFWDTTGHEDNGVSHCYSCDSITVLAEEQTDTSVAVSERKFNHEKWGTVDNQQVDELFTKPVKPFFDPRKVCSACLFVRNNQEVTKLTEATSFENINLNHNVQHINFP